MLYLLCIFVRDDDDGGKVRAQRNRHSFGVVVGAVVGLGHNQFHLFHSAHYQRCSKTGSRAYSRNNFKSEAARCRCNGTAHFWSRTCSFSLCLQVTKKKYIFVRLMGTNDFRAFVRTQISRNGGKLFGNCEKLSCIRLVKCL